MITIVGAGPVGNYLAYRFAKQNKDVRVVEEHKEIGKPVQCTGIVTSEFGKIIKPCKKFLINKVSRAKIFSSTNKFTEVKLTKENLILDRTKLDFYLHEQAKKEGAEYILGKRFEGNHKNKVKINNKVMKTDYLVGADGPFSTVAKKNNMSQGRKFIIGSQVRTKVNCEKDLVEFYLGVGSFAWLVPESEDIARVGVVSYDNPKPHLDKLLKNRCPGCKTIDRQGGFIPIYNPQQKLMKDNVLLVGDAATQVKATTFGGLVPGLIAAETMVDNIEDYHKKARKRLHKDLYLNLMIRRVMDRFKEKDYDDLVGMFMKDKVRKIIEEKDRDFPSKFILQLLLKEPRLLKFSSKLII
ncbi:NAD(P)/FAD-dependent oxidoreductase [archaeon]|mgnify:CR=1 FL=1|jgi:digeranylgeranylglycerophospholipid reductase|nr:NAD(P)/FAD-dependent oxidoreductase [archaeon]MBT4396970.1 NAD(P)/FAD-dependent oxidoreductase [archaeon]MBT4440961.1 NAD(P)/FAD-dependent oxidoreductase [archaeon]